MFGYTPVGSNILGDSALGTPPDTIPPSMNGSLTISAITLTGAHVAWQAGSDNVGVVGYEISCDTGTPSWTAVGNVLATDLSQLTQGTTYTARVRDYDAAGLRGTPITATFTTDIRKVSLSLSNADGSAAANLSALRWAWFDAATPDVLAAPANKGTAGATDANGLLTLNLPNTTLTAGATGWLIVTNSAGNASAAHSAFSGPVVVS